MWNLKWTDKDRASSTGEDDEMEVLMSISSDGRITQWMIRKGFESSGNYLISLQSNRRNSLKLCFFLNFRLFETKKSSK